MQAGAPEVLALPQGDDQRRCIDRGTLAVLDNQVDQTTGTIKLKATFPNTRLQLWPGAFVTVRLKVDVKHDAIAVPPVAVQRGPRGPYVYVVDSERHRDPPAGHRRPRGRGRLDHHDGLKPASASSSTARPG